MIKNEKQI